MKKTVMPVSLASCAGSLPTFFAPPTDLLLWTHGAVAMRLPATTAHSQFPANLNGMLVLRSHGVVYRAGHTTALPPLALIGPSATPMVFTHSGDICSHGLLLTPPAVSWLSGRFNQDTAGQDIDLQTLRPRDAERLYHAWASANDDAGRCTLLFAWLRDLLHHEAHEAQRWSRIAELPPLLMQGHETACAQLRISRRQLERLSRLQLGMSPHRARAVMRAHALLFQAMATTGLPDGADLALSHGYWDQSHMSRDLKKLVGTPLARTLAASQGLDPTQWALHVGRQQVNPPAPRGAPNTRAAQTPSPVQNTSTHTATGGASGARATPKH